MRFMQFWWIGIGCAMLLGCSPEPSLDDAALQLMEAREAVEAGDTDKAVQLLTASIEARPDPWAYYERAKIAAKEGEDDDAKADIEAGLELDPEHSELLWLEKQVKKPRRSRFKGKSGQPPMYNK